MHRLELDPASAEWAQRSARYFAPLLLIGDASVRPIAAVLLATERPAICWYNRRLVRGPKLALVELWARRQMVGGWSVRSLSAEALSRLDRDEA